MVDITTLNGKKESFEGSITEFRTRVNGYDNEEKNIHSVKVSPQILLKNLYIKKQSAKIRVKDKDQNLDQIWANVGEKTIKRIDPRIGEVISFDAVVVEIDLDNHSAPDIYLKSLSKIETRAKGSGQRFTDFWSSIKL